MSSSRNGYGSRSWTFSFLLSVDWNTCHCKVSRLKLTPWSVGVWYSELWKDNRLCGTRGGRKISLDDMGACILVMDLIDRVSSAGTVTLGKFSLLPGGRVRGRCTLLLISVDESKWVITSVDSMWFGEREIAKIKRGAVCYYTTAYIYFVYCVVHIV